MKKRIGMIVWGLSLASCASLPPPVPVISSSETPLPAARNETPGNPAIWAGGLRRHESGLAAAGFVAATARGDSLLVHDLLGTLQQRVAGPPLTDLDVVGLPLDDSFSVVLGGPERTAGRTRIVLFRLDRGPDQTVRRWAEIATDLSAPAGFCMRQSNGIVQAVVIDRRGETRQFTVGAGPDGDAMVAETRRFRVSRAGRGCAIEPGRGYVYFSHAREGFWRYRLDPSANEAAVQLRATAPHALPRSLGLAFLTGGSAGYLTSLDQDRAAFSVWGLGGADLTWLGRFEVREQPGGRAVRALSGVDAYGAELGSFSNGLVVVQDEANDGSPNLKYVDWAEVKRALGF